MKRILLIFVFAFILNLIWENLHSILYDNYMGGDITSLILLRATLVDAVIITIITVPVLFSKRLKNQDWIIIFTGIIISVGIEYYALRAGRWAYNSLMPIIPILGGIGLTPAIQLGLLGYISYKIEEYIMQ